MTNDDAPLRAARVGQIAINVHDLERATAFYRDTLGLAFLFAVPNMAFFDCGGVRLMLGAAEAGEFDHPASIIYYRVDDLHATAASLEQRGVRFEQPPHLVAPMPDHDLWMAFFRDADANMLALMAEVPRG
jgi:catechol 2,3-dioxygenase-like lactoylglutathione lyase family enzyme